MGNKLYDPLAPKVCPAELLPSMVLIAIDDIAPSPTPDLVTILVLTP